METQDSSIGQPVSISDILGLATWNRERSSAELQDFISRKHAALPDDTEIA